jgi:peptide/nickel transport system substrate-binding protein
MRAGIRNALALLAAGALLAGCGQSGSTGGTAGGDSVVVGEVTGVQKIDPQVATKFVDVAVLGLIYQPLIKLDPQLKLQPNLATSWSFGDGGKSLTLKLRKGVKFHDGSAFTAADAKASLQRVMDPATGAAARSYVASVASIDTPDDGTLVLHLSRPDASIVSGLASVNLAMLPAGKIQDGSIAKAPDGTGPFRFAAWDPQTSFSLTRNDAYWNGAPKLKKVQVRVIPDEQSMTSALRANTVQVGILSQPQVAKQLNGGGIQLQKVLGLSYRALMLQSKGPLAKPEARLAIQCAIDRGQVVKAAVLGDGKVVGPVPQGPYASDPGARPCPTRNAARAKQYLAQAGVPNGFTFTAMYAPEEDPTSEAQVVSVQSQLAQVGIQMKPDNQAGDAYVQRWLAGSFDAAFALNGAGTDPSTMYDRYFGTGANLAKAAGYSSPQVAQLLQQGNATTDAAARKSVYERVYKQLENDAAWIWLFDADQYTALTSRVHGYRAVPTGSLESLATTTLG